MRAVPLFTLCLLAMALIPAGAGDARAPLLLPIAPDEVVEIVLEGNGWNALRLQATDAVDLTFTVAHPDIDDLCSPAWPLPGIYDEPNLTAFFLFGAGGDPFSGEYFVWTGTPHSRFWPAQTGECGVSDTFSMAAGATAEFVIADTVGGYTITLESGAPGAERSLAVPLSHHARFARDDPEPNHSLGTSIPTGQVAHERRWSTTFDVANDVLFLATWQHYEGLARMPASAGAGISWQHMDIVPAGSETGIDYTTLPLHSLHIAGGGDRLRLHMVHLNEPGLYDLVYERTDVEATLPSGKGYGAYFASVPMTG